MKNDMTDLMFRCKVAYLRVPSSNRRYAKMVAEKMDEMVLAGKDHIEEEQMKDFIASVARFEKYIKGAK